MFHLRAVEKLKEQLKTLTGKHDQLADIKAANDSDEKINDESLTCMLQCVHACMHACMYACIMDVKSLPLLFLRRLVQLVSEVNKLSLGPLCMSLHM